MTVSSVSASGLVHCGRSHETSKMVDCVASKLKLSPEHKKKYIDEIDLAVNECVVPHLNHFSKETVSLIRAGGAPHISLFMIINAYVDGKKINDTIPEFVAALFSDKGMRAIERGRKLIQEGRSSPWEWKVWAECDLESFKDWTGLEVISPKEEIAAVFIPPDRRPCYTEES